MQNHTLYFGDNLEILREKISDESFDLIYLDPPFNSNRNYNVIFKEGLQDSPAQIRAFEDSWHWTRDAQMAFEELTGIRQSKIKINQQIADLMLALEKLVGHNDMLAYLTMMTIRLIELKRVLKNTGSIYLHCDPTASHYLKIVMDAIFEKKNFRNEIIWKRKSSSASDKSISRSHDVIFYYTKSDDFIFNQIYVPYSEDYIKSQYTHKDEKGVYRIHDVVANPALGGSSPRYTYKGYTPKTRWLISQDKLEELDKRGKILRSKSGKPYRKLYLDEMKGQPLGDVWTDISISLGDERLKYATQKPEALLERIIKASSNEGDLVLDPFCGCGTTVAVAERLNRNWVGIDITMLAINLIRHRLAKQFEGIKIFIDGRPKDVSAAKALFKKDPFEFEYWSLDLVNAAPSQSKTKRNMRGADKGIDGVINFIKDIVNSQQIYGKILVQVKGGSVHRDDIATLKGDVDREKASGGLLITLEPPTQPMKQEAVSAGNYEVSFSKAIFPKIQILTIEDLLNNKKPDIPLIAVPYYKEAKAAKVENRNNKLWI